MIKKIKYFVGSLEVAAFMSSPLENEGFYDIGLKEMLPKEIADLPLFSGPEVKNLPTVIK